MKYIACVIALLLSIAAPVEASQADPTLVASAKALLADYAAKNTAAAATMIDPAATVYGERADEVENTPDAVRALFQSDGKQWKAASFGALRNVSSSGSGDMGTLFFDAPFSCTFADGTKRTLWIRFATVWHRVNGHWLLLQSTNHTLTD